MQIVHLNWYFTLGKGKDDVATVQLEPGEIGATASTSNSGDGAGFKCNVCHKEFDRPESLVVHQFMHKKFHQCCDCKRSFVSAENLNKHKKDFKHVFKCKICQAEFASRDNCKSHAASHTRQHECQDCKKKFFTEKALERHREKVWNVIDKALKPLMYSFEQDKRVKKTPIQTLACQLSATLMQLLFSFDQDN